MSTPIYYLHSMKIYICLKFWGRSGASSGCGWGEGAYSKPGTGNEGLCKKRGNKILKYQLRKSSKRRDFLREQRKEEDF